MNIIEKDLSRVNLNGMGRSEEVRSILFQEQGVVEKWGIFIIIFIFFLLIAGTWFVKYPDVVVTHAFLTSENAPKEIVCKAEGRIKVLFYKNGDFVNEGDVMGWIDNLADYKDVISLRAAVDSFERAAADESPLKSLPVVTFKGMDLGELQGAYTDFIKAWQQYNDYYINGFYDQKMLYLLNDIQLIRRKNQVINEQQFLAEEDLNLVKETYEMNRKLEEDKVISRDELRRQTSTVINKKISKQDLLFSLISNEAVIRDKEKEIAQITHDKMQNKVAFLQAVRLLKSSLSTWVERYAIRSSTSGNIVYSSFIQNNQLVTLNQHLGYIVPSKTSYYLKTNLRQDNFGKIGLGADVQIRFNSYPYNEFGIATGKLIYISQVASDSGFLGKIHLVNGLKTTQRFKIPYKEGLGAQAVIVTKDMRLFQRLYYNLVGSSKLY